VLAAIHATEVSLIVSGLAAAGSVAAVVLTYRLGVRRFEHERRLADLDAVRLVIDEAAASMQGAHRKMATIYKHLATYERRAEGKAFPLVREHRLQLENAHDDLAAQQGRLEIRFGSDHELANICRGVGSSVLRVALEADQIEQAPAVASEDRRNSINQAILEAGLGRIEFVKTANRSVGVRLPVATSAPALADGAAGLSLTS
jgi:hypothetical protein